MQVVIACVLTLVSVALAAPYSSDMFLRRPRSHGYGSYISPCASASALHTVPVYHPTSSYQLNLGAVQGYPAQAHYGGYAAPHYGGYAASHYGGYAAPHYRANDMEDNTGEEPEMMSFSEDPATSDTMQARYVSLGGGYGGYGGHGLSGASASSAAAAAAASPGAVGVFPGANVGGCAVPLLLSCSPSVVSGRLVKSQYGSHYAPAYGAAAALPVAGAEAYRGVDEPHQESAHVEHKEPAEHATTVHEAAAPDTTRTQ